MVDTYPAEVEVFHVVGRLARGVVDSVDAGEAPDLLPVVGASVIFKPNIDPQLFRIPVSGTPVTIFQETIEATTDANGDIIVPDEDTPGVTLAWGGSPDINPTGWTWQVTIQVGNFPQQQFDIYGSPDAILDVSSLIPVAPDDGEPNPWFGNLVLVSDTPPADTSMVWIDTSGL